ncbi:MAG: TIGR03663 family protein [Kiritimatiellae bacterium]|nr:TIGR03663 family protein [Kiritimatiellia bacterium]
MKKNALYIAALIAVFAAALALRIPQLDQKPLHGDEANQAVRAGMLMDSGVYHYDPADHHGPVMYFAAMPFCRATASSFAETTEWNFRLVTVAFSVLTMVLMLGLGFKSAGGLFSNRSGMLFALLFTALSPALTYYSRFFIQESMLVCFLTGMLICGHGYLRSRESTGNLLLKPAVMAALFGLFAGLCIATKETAVLSFAAMFVAALTVFGPKRLLQFWSSRDALIATGSAILVAVLFFSSFFTYPQGVADALFATVKTYFFRATKVPEHQHPWNFYLKIIFWFKYGRGPLWSEAGVLIPAAVALGVAVTTWVKKKTAATAHTRFVLFLAVYTLVLTFIYSAIPYKTPWCALSFLHGAILLAGVGAGYIIDRSAQLPTRALRTLAYLSALWLTAWLAAAHTLQNQRACGKLAADPRNPYVYAHTGRDAMELVASIERAAAAAQGFDTFIAIAVPTPDTWPLPWYLRRYRNVGYWTRIDQIPASLQPTIIVAAADQGDAAAERFGKDMQANFFGIRPGILLNLFVPPEAEE